MDSFYPDGLLRTIHESCSDTDEHIDPRIIVLTKKWKDWVKQCQDTITDIKFTSAEPLFTSNTGSHCEQFRCEAPELENPFGNRSYGSYNIRVIGIKIPDLPFTEDERNYLNSKFIDGVYNILTTGVCNLEKYTPMWFLTCACIYGYLEIAQWTISIWKDINLSISCFTEACSSGNLELVKWIHNCIENSLSLTHFNRAFSNACRHGCLNIAKWIYSSWKPTSQNTPADLQLTYPFECACRMGHLEIMKWLYSLRPASTINYNEHYVFDIACINGYLEIAKWLFNTFTDLRTFLERKTSINNNIFNYEDSFHFACQHGHLEMAKWLLSIFPNINIRYCLKHNYVDSTIVDWLESICLF